MSEDIRQQADEVYNALLQRTGEGAPRAGLAPTRRVLELLGDPQRAYPVIHVTGTNGKTSTSRLIESLLRAHGLRTGLFTSPHVTRFTERIMIDGEPITDDAVVANWQDVEPYIGMIDEQLQAEGGQRLTFFEALTVLAFASFADAPIDVAIVEVGMGGEWDSTNVADAQIAVFTPIDLDHTDRLGRTITEIARTKSGIIKPASRVVSAAQTPEAAAVLAAAAEKNESALHIEGEAFALERDDVAVGGQLIDVRGRAASYPELFLPLLGRHQGQNAALAIAVVETFLGDGTQALNTDTLEQGLGQAASPGRLQIVGTEPSVIVDAAHNPHGARALAAAVTEFFDFTDVALVVGILADKDARGVLEALRGSVSRVFVTQSESERAIPATELAAVAREVFEPDVVFEFDYLEDAVVNAREWAGLAEGRAVIATGSITLIGDVVSIADDRGWRE